MIDAAVPYRHQRRTLGYYGGQFAPESQLRYEPIETCPLCAHHGRGRQSRTEVAQVDRVEWAAADLTDPSETRWREAWAGVDAVVHFAAQNPYPDAPWSDACASFDMTLNMLAAAVQGGTHRVVFASSNHVMGQYKDSTLADGLTAGALTTALPPGPGTRWFNGHEMVLSR